MLTILITGACGGVGSWTVDHFAEQGHDVVGVDRRTPENTRKNVDFKTANLTDYGETRHPDRLYSFQTYVRIAHVK